MSIVTEEGIRMIRKELSDIPRKPLGFKTPAEALHQSRKRVGLLT